MFGSDSVLGSGLCGDAAEEAGRRIDPFEVEVGQAAEQLGQAAVALGRRVLRIVVRHRTPPSVDGAAGALVGYRS